MPCFQAFPKKTISSLQLLPNSAAGVLMKTRRQVHITPVLKSLHWIPVCFRIGFKVLLLVSWSRVFSYLCDHLLPHEPSRTLRSSGTGLLSIPHARFKSYGLTAFCYYGPHLWNRLPGNLRAAEALRKGLRLTLNHQIVLFQLYIYYTTPLYFSILSISLFYCTFLLYLNYLNILWLSFFFFFMIYVVMLLPFIFFYVSNIFKSFFLLF